MVWNIGQVSSLIASLQAPAKTFGYHVALGGGVLNRGTSDKDADFYFLPLDNEVPVNPDGLVAFLRALWGDSTPIGREGYPPNATYRYREIFRPVSGRIDTFII